ncbi:MAG TPA: ABC transporter permease [Pyrinomonadaceae bacterium]|jgi:predicted permease|nr:ABC transporter permease [Pyrinomonadaceae bacterium]
MARISAWFKRAELDRDLDEELQTHLSLLVEQNLRLGLSTDEAMREARLKMGNVVSLREEHRDTRGLPLLDTLLQDLRYTFRILRRDTGFAFFAILIVGLGIGASAIVFSVLNTLLLRPLPLKDAESLVWIANNKSIPEQTSQVGHILDAREANQSFTELAAYFAYYSIGDLKLTDAGEPERLTAVPVSENFFRTLGVEPQAGRVFNADECRFNGPAAVILSDALWKRRFASSPEIIGKTLQLNGKPVRVVGVMPAAFDFSSVFAPGSRVDLFSPFPLTKETNRMGNTIAVVGRLKPGVTLESAQNEFHILGQRLTAEHYANRNEFQPVLSSLKTHVTGRLRPALIILGCAVALVMLIVCANLSNLMLARNATRRKEIAIRIALGAGRGRLIRQKLTESIVLSGAGAVAGVALAVIGTRVLSRLEAFSIPLLANVQVDLGVLAFTLVIAVVTGLTFGFVPALQVPAIRVNETLKDTNRSSTGGRKHGWIRSSLVVTEIAIACLLLVGTGLLIRSFLRVLDVDLGFQPEQLATLRVDPGPEYSTEAKRNAYFDEALRLVHNTPGIEACGLTDVLPLEGDRSWGVAGVGQVYTRENYPSAFVRIVSNGYFKAMGIPLLAGRDFTEHDNAASEQVIIINDSLARRLWPDQNPIGQMVTQDGGRRVVGIVGGVRHVTVEQESGLEMYLPIRQTDDFSAVELVVRTSLPDSTAGATIRAALKPLDPNLGSKEFRSVQHLVDKATSPRRFVVMMLAGFSGFSLVLAALGIYAVISYSVQQRTREIGIRTALGASPGSLQRHILFETLRLAAIGLSIGLCGSLIVTRSLASLLFGVKSYDPASFTATVIVLVVVATLAGYFPARRASQIDPIRALRSN